MSLAAKLRRVFVKIIWTDDVSLAFDFEINLTMNEVTLLWTTLLAFTLAVTLGKFIQLLVV